MQSRGGFFISRSNRALHSAGGLYVVTDCYTHHLPAQETDLQEKKGLFCAKQSRKAPRRASATNAQPRRLFGAALRRKRVKAPRLANAAKTSPRVVGGVPVCAKPRNNAEISAQIGADPHVFAENGCFLGTVFVPFSAEAHHLRAVLRQSCLAFRWRRPAPRLIQYSDRDSQGCSA